MTSLKPQYVDEIVASMAEMLGDKDFMSLHKKAALEKVAKSTQEYLSAYQAAQSLNEVETIHNEVQATRGSRSQQEEEALHNAYQSAKSRFSPGEKPVPIMSDDGQAADDGKENVAADFALKNLSEVADALDSNGFEHLANFIDEAMTKIASKKK